MAEERSGEDEHDPALVVWDAEELRVSHERDDKPSDCQRAAARCLPEVLRVLKHSIHHLYVEKTAAQKTAAFFIK